MSTGDQSSTVFPKVSIELIQRSLALSVYNLDVEQVGCCVGSMQSDRRAEWRPLLSGVRNVS
jgi:hypothetical protein